MKKKRLPKPSEIVLPEIKQDKVVSGKNIIYSPCPQCERNNKFKIIEVLVQPTFNIKYDSVIPTDEILNDKKVRVRAETFSRAGRYRCECTVCGFIQTFTSKNPKTGSYGN